MKKFRIIVFPIWLLVSLCSSAAYTQSYEVDVDYYEEYPGVDPIDVKIITTHASDLQQLRHMTLDRYAHVLEQIKDQIIHDPSPEQAKMNVGPALLKGISQELKGWIEAHDDVPAVKEVIDIYESVNERVQKSIGYQITPNSKLWILEAIDQVDEMLADKNFEVIIKDKLLDEIRAIPRDSEDRIEYSHNIAVFQNLGIRWMVPEKDMLEYKTYLNYLNQMYEKDKQGHIFFDFEMDTEDNLGAVDWTPDNIDHMVIGIEAPFGWELAARLNELNRENGFYRSLLELNLHKVITFLASDDTLTPPKIIYDGENEIAEQTANSKLVEFVINQDHPYCGEFEL